MTEVNKPKSAHTGLKRLGRVAIGGAVLLSAAACNTLYDRSQPSAEGIGYRDARYQEVAAMREFRDCRDQAVALDDQARQSHSAGQYLASARLLDKCEADLGPEVAGIASEERMRAYGLSIQNYVKGGDMVSARANYESFQQAFPDQDLYYPDGTSFLETMGSLLGRQKETGFGQFSTLNVNRELKDEMRRVTYWQQN